MRLNVIIDPNMGGSIYFTSEHGILQSPPVCGADKKASCTKFCAFAHFLLAQPETGCAFALPHRRIDYIFITKIKAAPSLRLPLPELTGIGAAAEGKNQPKRRVGR
ncbi:hypothetical protein [Candidatus Electronema sp. JC]|uniref:hypothetical protein n=1 Tax=Candidatus Electronema sp. JC TaxID=3401570 RepID=UPI003B43014E